MASELDVFPSGVSWQFKVVTEWASLKYQNSFKTKTFVPDIFLQINCIKLNFLDLISVVLTHSEADMHLQYKTSGLQLLLWNDQ